MTTLGIGSRVRIARLGEVIGFCVPRNRLDGRPDPARPTVLIAIGGVGSAVVRMAEADLVQVDDEAAAADLARLAQMQAVLGASLDDHDDMAVVGRSLMDAISLATADQSSPLYGWVPAQDPAEIVFDLIDMVEQRFDWRSFVVRWAADRWRAEVQNRPLQNVHRRALDTTWRQVMRHFGGDPDVLVGPSHDELADRATGKGGDA